MYTSIIVDGMIEHTPTSEEANPQTVYRINQILP